MAIWSGPVSDDIWTAAIFSNAINSNKFVLPMKSTTYFDCAILRISSAIDFSPTVPDIIQKIPFLANRFANSPQYLMGHFLFSPLVPGTRSTYFPITPASESFFLTTNNSFL